MKKACSGCQAKPTLLRSFRRPLTVEINLSLTGTCKQRHVGNKLSPTVGANSLIAIYSNTDVHTVASLLKLYLRELPEPVVPFCKYEDFLTCAQLLAKDEEEVSDRIISEQIWAYLKTPT